MSSSIDSHLSLATREPVTRQVAGLSGNLPLPPGLPDSPAQTSVSFGGGHASPTLWDWLLNALPGGKGG
jgi:hypothetical protein